ncbi:hypothetical protein RJJ37_00930 [Rhizobium redzepovicii]|uniref:Uncharacterized protein n=1 Tax=Rhizobium redzepovicii TaxID=2867518 RepID=A0AAW8NTJ5_9HYPH|nr:MULTISPECIES: hypothetical protein [Rhizobium]MBY4591667.1 hypothetical protein [Rhizobium redzepovicii]MBY4613254.1 hypothetical protein [Rhizobium redzepovicii]MDF0657908.1 hypothetical protein [Rhizobium sp. BC49]MDR9758208.1 hypothetical protein [Rhizobium redzepovicii]MDR9779250.1 hypothetical protein [Rhizobium redzepovicii]
MFSLLDTLKMGAGIAAGLVLYHLYAVSIGYPSAAREARAGYILLAEKSAADARAAEMERQRNAASQAIEEHRKRLAAAEASEQAARDTLETEIQSYELQLSEKNRACAVTAADRQWLLRH